MADDALEDDRIIELSSIAAIFPEICVDPSDPYHASLDLAVTPLHPLTIKFHQPTGDDRLLHLPGSTTTLSNGRPRIVDREQNTALEDVHTVKHLPPLKLDILLRPGYPISEPPVVHLITDSPWLPRNKLQELELSCTRLWDETGRDHVVFSYIDYLLQQAEYAFGMAGGDSVVSLSPDLRLALLDFDRRTRRQKFEQETFNCGVCLEPKKGKDCHRLLHCDHVFCTSCLTDFYASCITEGDVDSVKCMHPTCGKHANDDALSKPKRREATLNPSELLQIPLSQDLVQRYVRLKRKKKLESSKNTIYCPRQWCQGPAYPEYRKKKAEDDFYDFSDTEDGDGHILPTSSEELRNLPMNQRLAICSDCSYAFCFVCRKTWHGSHLSAAALCNPRDPALLAAEEQASLEYLRKHSTPCPTCGAPAQKTMGCNHMICFRCKTHFCYLCASYLMEDNPFAHFNDMRSPCHMRLWELEGGDGADAANHWAGVGGEGVAWDEDLTSGDDVDDGNDDNDDHVENRAQPAQNAPLAVPAADRAVPHHDTDSSDEEEPAPDVLRHRRGERAIEFVNFAANPGGGADGRRIINIPDDDDDNDDDGHPEVAPLPAPAAPRQNQRGHGQQANRLRRQQQHEPPHNLPWRRHRQQQQQQPQHLQEAPPAPHHPNRHNNLLPRAAPGQNNHDAANPAPARALGLERFLELARLDAEDEWDSDELDDDDDWGELWDVHDDFPLHGAAAADTAATDTAPFMAALAAAAENVVMGRHEDEDEPGGQGFARGGGRVRRVRGRGRGGRGRQNINNNNNR